MAIRIPFIADVAAALRGTKDLASGLEDVVDSLDDVDTSAADAARGVEKLGESGRDLEQIERATDDAADSADKLERRFRDAFDAVKKESRSAGDDLGDNVKRGTDRAEDGLGEFRDEANSTARESAASFDGSAESIGDSFQEVAANAFAGFGPAGAVAGLALAAGFGIFRAKAQEETEAAERLVSDMFDNMLESGAEFVNAEFITDQITKIYKGAEDARISVDELRKIATETKISEPLLARALVGDEQAQAQVKTEISARRLQINEALDEATAKGQNLAPTLSPAIEALRTVEDRVNSTSGAFGTAQTNAQAAAAAIAGITAPTQGVAASAEDARAKFDGLGRKIAELPDTKRIALDVDTGPAERTLRAFRPVVIGEFRAGKAVV